MSMLLPHMLNVIIVTKGIQEYIARLNENKRCDALKRAVVMRVIAHTVQIIIRYARIDSVRGLNGQ